MVYLYEQLNFTPCSSLQKCQLCVGSSVFALDLQLNGLHGDRSLFYRNGNFLNDSSGAQTKQLQRQNEHARVEMIIKRTMKQRRPRASINNCEDVTKPMWCRSSGECVQWTWQFDKSFNVKYFVINFHSMWFQEPCSPQCSSNSKKPRKNGTRAIQEWTPRDELVSN